MIHQGDATTCNFRAMLDLTNSKANTSLCQEMRFGQVHRHRRHGFLIVESFVGRCSWHFMFQVATSQRRRAV